MKPAKNRKAIILIVIFGGILFLFLFFTFRSLFGPPVIYVINRSHYELESVNIGGRGFSVLLTKIPPGKSRAMVVKPRGESGVSLLFAANGKDFKAENLSYIEPFGGYCATIDIGPDFKTSARTELSCFSLRRAVY
jgi:hypothetical protein